MGSALSVEREPKATPLEEMEFFQFTKFPNRFFDLVHRLQLDSVQTAMLALVLRRTLGFHRETAPISNKEFADFANCSPRTISQHKAILISKRVLVRTVQGTGLTTSQYGINFDYDRDQGEPETADHPDHSDAENPEAPSDAPLQQPPPPPAQETTPEPPPHDPEPAESPEPAEQAKSRVEDSSMPIEDPGPGDRDHPQTNGQEPDNLQARKKIVRSVCRVFRSLGFEPKPENYMFLHWAAKRYGISAMQGKLDILNRQRARGVKFTNPWGWLRSALSRDYQHNQYDRHVLEAKERSKRAIERSQRESEEWRAHVEKCNQEREEKPGLADHWGKIFEQMTGESPETCTG